MAVTYCSKPARPSKEGGKQLILRFTYTFACRGLGRQLSLLGHVPRILSLGVSTACHTCFDLCMFRQKGQQQEYQRRQQTADLFDSEVLDAELCWMAFHPLLYVEAS